MTKLLIKTAISCVLLALLLWRVPLDSIGAHMRSFDPFTLFEVLGVSLGCWFVAAARQWCLLPNYSYRNLLHVTFVSRFYAMVLPGQIAGDFVKAYRLGRQSEQVGHAEAATLLDRALGLFALFLISAAMALQSSRLPLALRLFFLLGALGLLASGVLAGSRFFRRGIVERFMSQRKGSVATFVREFSIALHEYLRRPIALIAALLIGLIFHTGCIFMQVLLGGALRIELPWANWTIVYAGVSLLMLLPISVAGLGLREGGYVGLLALFGYKASVALSLSFAILGTSLAATLVGGGLELIDAVNRFRAKPATGRATKR